MPSFLVGLKKKNVNVEGEKKLRKIPIFPSDSDWKKNINAKQPH